jgi:penicillin-binding protein 1C
MRDNWAMGWSQRYTVGVWVGNAGGSPMHDVSGSSGAAPIWADVMAWLHRGAPSHAPRPPAGVLRQPVRFDGGADRLESPREEWFVRGTQQAVFAIDIEASDAYIASASGKKHMNFGTPARIIAPAPGSIIALDPDIPPAHQRLQLQAQGGTALRWRIDGRPVGQGAALAWLPWPGRHRVELLDAQGQMQDSVQIEVRGAGVKPGPGRPGGAGGAMP